MPCCRGCSCIAISMETEQSSLMVCSLMPKAYAEEVRRFREQQGQRLHRSVPDQHSGCWEPDKGYDSGPSLHQGAKNHCFPFSQAISGIQVYQSQAIAKHITTPPSFIVPKRYGRDANCTSVTHTSDLSVKVLLYFGHSLSWMAQVSNDKVKAPEPSRYCSWFMIQLNQSSRRKLACLYSC